MASRSIGGWNRRLSILSLAAVLVLGAACTEEAGSPGGSQGGADTPVAGSPGTGSAPRGTSISGGSQGGADDSSCVTAAGGAGTPAATGSPRATGTARATASPRAAATGSPQASPSPGAQGTGTPAQAMPLPNVRDPGLVVERIEGLKMPTQIAFLGVNDLLVTEKTGNVVRVQNGQVTGPVLQLSANYADERGVLGITLHPEFERNRWVYIYWTWTGEGNVPAGLIGDPSDDIELVPENGNRVDRFRWDGARLSFDCNVIELPSRTTDLTLNRRRGNHDAGVIQFGPDGKLYIVNGDHNVRGQLTNVQSGPAIGDSGLIGAVLRLNDDGSTPQDNPFVSQGDLAGKIWVYGVRNSFGFDFDPKGGGLWLQVNGQASYDQIGRYERGDNVGWIQLLGPPERFDDFKQLEINTERKLDNPAFPPEMLAANSQEALSRLFLMPGAKYNPPEFAWRMAVAPAGFGFIDGAGLGAEYDGDLLVGDVNTGNIWRLKLSADRQSFQLAGGLADKVNDNDRNNPVGEMADSIFGSGFLVATDIEQGPDGALWITSAAGNAVYRIARR